ncbi:MAG: hypothetical protein LBG96_09740 [Tannerella sp.]|nr:hypothetical protein [Tannerella sp.]
MLRKGLYCWRLIPHHGGKCGGMGVLPLLHHRGGCRLSALAVGRLYPVNVTPCQSSGEALSPTKPWG